MERYELSIERIRLCLTEETTKEPYLSYFREVASFVLLINHVYELICTGKYKELTLMEMQEINQKLYADILPDQYDKSYANPVYAAGQLGEYGPYLSFLYSELRGMIPDAFEQQIEFMTIYQELLIELYNMFEEGYHEDGSSPKPEDVKNTLYWFMSDYCDISVTRRVRSQLEAVPEDFATSLIMHSDLSDLRYLYLFGEYVSDHEIKTAEYLNAMSEESIQRLANVYTEGYRLGFVNSGRDLSKKKVVNIRYRLGFERMVRVAISHFEKMGLKPTIFRTGTHSIDRKSQSRIGYYGAIPNKQYDYDHSEDEAIYLDRDFVNRRIGVLKTAYEKHKEWAAVHAGPACIETFGEAPFTPVVKAENLRLSEHQQKYAVAYSVKAGEIVNQYIRGDERSFTIIAFPIPEIGDQFEEIFDATVLVNTLDYKRYQFMQQGLIDLLDTAAFVRVKGMNGNHTDLQVALYPLQNAEKETVFENCVADVNIPVGEVFTSPVLKGTTGVLHVKESYLEELRYENLELIFTDGYVTGYSCTNYSDEKENRKLIKDHILYHHETLAMGEFAIGTNTTAYHMAKKYGIEDRLPTLIAEKTGPHFAVGDTCYSHSEDVKVYNPDGKEIIARDNEKSILRKIDISKAYDQCHTDITIPYEELGELTAIRADGSEIEIIRNGRFIPDICAQLNEMLDFH